MASIYGFSIKNHKSFIGREGYGDQGDICYGGEKVGWYNDDGNGGCADIDFYQAGEQRNEYEQLFKAAVKKYYKAHPMTGEFVQLTPTAELFMNELLTIIVREKNYKSLAKKGYPFVIMFVDYNDHNGEMVGLKTAKSAKNYMDEKGTSNAITYSSLADFIIK